MSDPFRIAALIAIFGWGVWLVWMLVRWIRFEIRLANLEEEEDDEEEQQ